MRTPQALTAREAAVAAAVAGANAQTSEAGKPYLLPPTSYFLLRSNRYFTFTPTLKPRKRVNPTSYLLRFVTSGASAKATTANTNKKRIRGITENVASEND